MEDLERQTTTPDGGELPGYDPLLLERVWARVLQGRGDGESVGRLLPMEDRGQTRDKEPACFGRDGNRYEDLLRQMLEGEWEDARIYSTLARRAGGDMARTLSELARQERSHAGRLGAAWFILTGRRYRWGGHGQTRPPVSLANGLREQFLQERREAQAYAEAARETGDPCLRALFEELAKQEQEQLRTLYGLLERL